MGTCLKYQKRSEIGDYALQDTDVEVLWNHMKATSRESKAWEEEG